MIVLGSGLRMCRLKEFRAARTWSDGDCGKDTKRKENDGVGPVEHVGVMASVRPKPRAWHHESSFEEAL
jgi:hypothetical protein